VTTKEDAYFERYDEFIKDPRAEHFMPFNQEDHRALCCALYAASDDMRGAYRTMKYHSEYVDNPMVKDYFEAVKTTQHFWLVARAAYCKKYGQLP
jgi:hypothetical protein